MKSSKSEIANKIKADKNIQVVIIQGHKEEVSCQDAIDFLDTYKGAGEFAYSYGDFDFFIWIN